MGMSHSGEEGGMFRRVAYSCQKGGILFWEGEVNSGREK